MLRAYKLMHKICVQKAQALDSGYVAEFGDRVEAQLSQAKKELKEAMDLGDVDKQVEATS